jgi:hypothetical protein
MYDCQDLINELRQIVEAAYLVYLFLYETFFLLLLFRWLLLSLASFFHLFHSFVILLMSHYFLSIFLNNPFFIFATLFCSLGLSSTISS